MRLARVAGFGLAIASLTPVAPAQESELVWAGLVHEMFTIDGEEVWTVEDGGRIRHRFSNGWTFESTPTGIENTLRKVVVYDTTTSRRHWAVGQNGVVLRKIDAGPWSQVWQQPETDPNLSGFADLWDVREVPVSEAATNLYTLGLHGIWRADGHPSGTWHVATFYDDLGQPIPPAKLELYSFDFKTGPNGYALACGEPGLIFHQHDSELDRWDQVFDVRDLCGVTGALPSCVTDSLCVANLNFEMWDLEVSRNPSQDLAIAVGGLGSACGMAFSSTDGGITWRVEKHECKCPWAGCIPSCANDPLYNDDEGTQTDEWRLKKFNTLYDVGILHGDNTAIACGYGGQIVVRDPSDADPDTDGVQCVWRDRTIYSEHQLTTPNAVTMPQHAIATNDGDGESGIAWVAGQGGYVRRSDDGGQTWKIVNQGVHFESGQVVADHWRVRDVHFVNDQVGWLVAQRQVIRRTDDGGTTWSSDVSGAANSKPFLNAISCDANGDIGVAVGQIVADPMDPNGLIVPILYNLDLLNSPAWSEVSSVPIPTGTTVGHLNDVEWAGGLEFWIVGTQGLIFRSSATAGPSIWSLVAPDPPISQGFSNVTLGGVAFSGVSLGVFVGSLSSGGPSVGKAYWFDGNAAAGQQWGEITISASGVYWLTDVDFDGTNAYATGERMNGSVVEGVVLKSTYAAGAFSPFTLAGTFGVCDVGEIPTAVGVLTQVEIAPSGEIWVGGQCGRLWRSADGASWSAHRSASDAHVYGMSFAGASNAYQGYIAGHRANRTCQSIVKINP